MATRSLRAHYSQSIGAEGDEAQHHQPEGLCDAKLCPPTSIPSIQCSSQNGHARSQWQGLYLVHALSCEVGCGCGSACLAMWSVSELQAGGADHRLLQLLGERGGEGGDGGVERRKKGGRGRGILAVVREPEGSCYSCPGVEPTHKYCRPIQHLSRSQRRACIAQLRVQPGGLARQLLTLACCSAASLASSAAQLCARLL